MVKQFLGVAAQVEPERNRLGERSLLPSNRKLRGETKNSEHDNSRQKQPQSDPNIYVAKWNKEKHAHGDEDGGQIMYPLASFLRSVDLQTSPAQGHRETEIVGDIHAYVQRIPGDFPTDRGGIHIDSD
jgi:hypothetical protein